MKYKVILFDVDDTLLDFLKRKDTHYIMRLYSLVCLQGILIILQVIKRLVMGYGDLENKMITLSELAVDRFRQLFALHNIEVDAQQFSDVYLENLGKRSTSYRRCSAIM